MTRGCSIGLGWVSLNFSANLNQSNQTIYLLGWVRWGWVSGLPIWRKSQTQIENHSPKFSLRHWNLVKTFCKSKTEIPHPQNPHQHPKSKHQILISQIQNNKIKSKHNARGKWNLWEPQVHKTTHNKATTQEENRIEAIAQEENENKDTTLHRPLPTTLELQRDCASTTCCRWSLEAR